MGGSSDEDLPTAAERAAKAQRRIHELQQRRIELAAGGPSSLESAREAQRHADEALERAQEAHRAAAHRHDDLARERAANALQRAAMLGVDDPAALQERADAHWQAADRSHIESAQELTEAYEPRKSSSPTETHADP